MPTAEVNGITINYQLEGGGDGDLIVLVNGLADDLHTWDYQVPTLLETGYRLLRYDNRGIGKTSRPPAPYTAALLATDLHELLVKLGINSFHLIGASMGGMIVQVYALKYPNVVKDAPEMLSLSLCCTYAEPTIFCSRMFSVWADMAKEMSVQEMMRAVSLWSFTVQFFRTRPKELEKVEQARKGLDMSLEAFLAQLNVIQVFDTTSQLEALKKQGKVLGGLGEGQVMVLAGEEDILIPVSLSKELASLIEGAEWKTTKGGHGCMWESPQEFNEVVIDFLQRSQKA